MFSLCDSDADNIVIREQYIIDIITIKPSKQSHWARYHKSQDVEKHNIYNC